MEFIELIPLHRAAGFGPSTGHAHTGRKHARTETPGAPRTDTRPGAPRGALEVLPDNIYYFRGEKHAIHGLTVRWTDRA